MTTTGGDISARSDVLRPAEDRNPAKEAAYSLLNHEVYTPPPDSPAAKTALALRSDRPGRGRTETQAALDQAGRQTSPERSEKPEDKIEETTKGKSTIRVVNGLVRGVSDGHSQLTYEYQRGSDGSVLFENGEAKIASITGRVHGKEVNFDLAAAANSNDPEKRALAERISITQSGEDMGNLNFETADGLKLTRRAKDFAEETRDRIPAQKDGNEWRIRKITKENNQGVVTAARTWDYDDAHNKPTQLLHRNTYAGDKLVEVMQRRPNNDGFNVSTPGELKKREQISFDIVHGDMLYKEFKQTWFSGETEETAGGLPAARSRLQHLLKQRGAFDDEVKSWMETFEGKREGWIKNYRDKGWDAPDAKMIAGTYNAMGKFLTGERSGLGKTVSDEYRTALVLSGLRQANNPRMFNRQFQVGECAITAEMAGMVLRERPDLLYERLAEAVNTGKVTSTGTDRNGRHRVESLTRFDLTRTDKRDPIESLQQKMAARLLGLKGDESYPGTYLMEDKYIHSFIVGDTSNWAVHDDWHRRESTIPRTAEAALSHLRKGNILFQDSGGGPNIGHTMCLTDARINPRTNQLQFFLSNSYKQDENPNRYGPGTGWCNASQLGLRVNHSSDYYAAMLSKNKKR